MMSLVVFLRGVNVGGHRTFRPTILAEQLKHFDVVNIGAAGTFVIRNPTTQAHLRAELAQRLPFDTKIIIFNGSNIIKLMNENPFQGQSAPPNVTRFVSFLTRLPRLNPRMPMNFPNSGSWLLRILAREGRFVYGIYRRNMKVISYLGQLDHIFGVPVTTRNWNTITAIAKVLEAGRTTSPREVPKSNCKQSMSGNMES